jgi:hypothetical protein
MQTGARDDFVLIANHLDQSLRFDNLKQRGVVGSSCLLHSSLCSSLLYQSLDKVCTNVRPKPFCWAKPTCFNFSFPLLLITLQGHKLTTTAAALTKHDPSFRKMPKLPSQLRGKESKPTDFLNKYLRKVLLCNRFHKHTRFYYNTTLKQREWDKEMNVLSFSNVVHLGRTNTVTYSLIFWAMSCAILKIK